MIDRSVLMECKENTLKGLMEGLFSMEFLLLQNAVRSKKKDFERGRKVVDVVIECYINEIDV